MPSVHMPILLWVVGVSPEQIPVSDRRYSDLSLLSALDSDWPLPCSPIEGVQGFDSLICLHAKRQ